jgi:hypothetical protein
MRPAALSNPSPDAAPGEPFPRNKALTPNLISLHAFTVRPYYAITAYPAKRIETSCRVHYLWNSTNDNPPISTGAQSTQAGQAIHFNATAAYSLGKGLWIGPNAYYIKQITDGKIDGVLLRNSPEQVGAIGPGMVWNRGSWFLYANGYLGH